MNHHIALLKKDPKKLFAFRHTVSIMLEHHGKLLLVQESKAHVHGKWSQPAGHIEIGETPFQAAVRECKEETGYKVQITGLFRVYFRPVGKKENGYINYTFLARPVGKQSKHIAKDILATAWHTKEQLKKFPKSLARNPLVLERISHWLKGHKTIPLSYLREIVK